jgi:predicted TPR repeat methyltransferase
LPGGWFVNGDVTRNHYDRLAATYDENWAYSPEFVKWMTGCIVRQLRIKSSDLAADIGCGTGLYARGLAERAAAVACVEPSAAMLAQVPRGERNGHETASHGFAISRATGPASEPAHARYPRLEG